MNEFGPIHEPSENSAALLRAVQDLKRVVEMMTGVRGNAAAGRIIVQREQPAGSANYLWVRPALLKGETTTVSYWFGNKW
ncbi:MAG TPA: hypothetical protein PLV92_13060, partial [Pirellulaceae bacterium]|nr:hypothetical protein [Pirellulaceae bacterium]